MAGGLIIIVEDDPELRSFYRQSLTTVGFTVLDAATGKQGLSLVAMHRPRVLVLDIDLPGGLNGIEVCRRSKQMLGSGVPVLFITAADRLPVLEECVAAGGDDFLVKSSGFDAMLERISYWARAPRRTLSVQQRDAALTQVQAALEIESRLPQMRLPLSDVLAPEALKEAEPELGAPDSKPQSKPQSKPDSKPEPAPEPRPVPPAAPAPKPPPPPPVHRQVTARPAPSKAVPPPRPAAPPKPVPSPRPSAPPPAPPRRRVEAEAARNPLRPPTRLRPGEDPDITRISRFVERARSLLPAEFGEAEDERELLLGYVVGVVNSCAKGSFVMKIHFLEYLRASLVSCIGPQRDELEEIVKNLYVLYDSEVFHEACRSGEADFDALGHVDAQPRGLHDYAVTGVPP